MKNKSIFSIALLSFVVLALLAGMTGPPLGQGSVVSGFGRAQGAGREVIVHVTVVVPVGSNANQVALDAIRNQGARPFQSDPFTTTGLIWDQFSDLDAGNDSVIQNYNPAGDPTGGDGEAALYGPADHPGGTHQTWSEIGTSKFSFEQGTIVGRCPSLVRST